ncbi:ABC transporter permease [Streptomyces sp. NP-1717]|uniref:ABC transporter permease n=1 Tax=Streptomyces sp. NP-1717 TaxID=2704470 RepID=UPI001F5E34D8|nr:ABC transporter permease [Streptomyces sp. NP-1717]MCI3223048.1 ABC transporter permease [Streptomyces sp. NP-1717]
MSALLERPPAPAPAPPARTGLRGPAWVAVRQHRPALWTALLLAVLSVGCVVAARVWLGSAGAVVSCGEGCERSTAASGWFRWAENYVGGATVLLALLVAAFTAGPLIARELQTGMYRLAWTQSVSPARWLAVRLVGVAAIATAGAVLLAATFRWSRARSQEDPLLSMARSWSDREVYPALGVTAVGYILLAVAVGALAAVILRRTLLATAVGVAATGGVSLFFAWVRPYLWPVVEAEGGAEVNPFTASSDPWIVREGVVLADGSRMTYQQCLDTGFSKSPCEPGTTRTAVTHFYEYHPESHFWPLQLVETGMVLALAAACVFAAFKVLGRRHA